MAENQLIYRKERGKKGTVTGDPKDIQPGDYVSYYEPSESGIVNAVVELVRPRAGVLRTAPTMWNKNVLRRSRRVKFEMILKVERPATSQANTHKRVPLPPPPPQIDPPPPVPTGPRDPRLPPAGTILRRSFCRKPIRVLVREHNLEWKGTLYYSLAELAKAITGTPTDPYAFFGL